MLRERETSKQKEYEIVLLDELVPQDHILRKIDAAVDFSFIHDLCKDLYSPNMGRPAIEPELLFRMLFIGYLYGIKSETKLAQQVNENIAFKWFLGLKLTEKGPDHATISLNRVRRFRDNNIAEKIFDNILKQCIEKKLVQKVASVCISIAAAIRMTSNWNSAVRQFKTHFISLTVPTAVPWKNCLNTATSSLKTTPTPNSISSRRRSRRHMCQSPRRPRKRATAAGRRHLYLKKQLRQSPPKKPQGSLILSLLI